jgi:SNF2 family DNA or RNA helicase
MWLHSAKTRELWQYLEKTFHDSPDDKVVLFSQWTTCLDLLALMLEVMGLPFSRFDGRVNSMDERGDIIVNFREHDECRVLLTSLGAGGEGLNLTFANHVILMEPYWNCAVEQQAVDRLHRIGQQRITHVVRLLMPDSIEDWVREIQTKKTKELERLLCGKEIVDTRARPTFRLGGGVVTGTGDHVLTAKARFNEPYAFPVEGAERPVDGLGRFLKQFH